MLNATIETYSQPLRLIQYLRAGTQLKGLVRSTSTTNGYFTLSQGSHNLELITEINHNATSAHTRLRDDYNAVQQTLVLCTLEAQVAYMNSMREAHEELQQCRSELGREGDGDGEGKAETESPN